MILGAILAVLPFLPELGLYGPQLALRIIGAESGAGLNERDGNGARHNAERERGVEMRTIADSAGIQWTVFEVERQDTAVDRWSHLPPEFANGWLCFESDFSKRRLTPVPHRWSEFSDAELERLLVLAHSVRRIRADLPQHRHRD